MIADRLAIELAERFVAAGDRVLDPFCGTGRTLLAAAARGAECVGVDVNPLAVLLVRAKVAKVGPERLEPILWRIRGCSRSLKGPILEFEFGRQVSWFGPRVREELSELIQCLNCLRMQHDALDLVAGILSATVREVSYCRNDQWKLHRMDRTTRQHFRQSPHEVFARRLEAVINELRAEQPVCGKIVALNADSRCLRAALRARAVAGQFDSVITSPPYGDSRTTVQYGAMSGICLGVLRYLRGLSVKPVRGGDIDRVGLGGAVEESEHFRKRLIRQRYWHGGVANPRRRRIEAYLHDLDRCCEEIAAVLRPGGHAVVVVGRRFVGGWRLNLNLFVVRALRRRGFRLEANSTRRIVGKTTPVIINKVGRSQGRVCARRVVTMREEHVLSFVKT